MLTRLRIWWLVIRDSLWFLPAAMALAWTAMAFALVEVDRSFAWKWTAEGEWLFGGGVEGSRGVLSTVAGSLITVTGVVFSITIVALQLASSQFAPRILRSFISDRSNQTVLGVLLGTFAYTLVVLRVIRSESDDSVSFVPHIAVAVAMVSAFVSLGFLIYYLHHVARSMQATYLAARITADALGLIDRLYSKEESPEEDAHSLQHAPPVRAFVTAQNTGYLQAVDGARLFELGQKLDALISMQVKTGAFVVEGEVLAAIHSHEAVESESIDAVRDGCVLGSERTSEQDVELVVGEMVDMAVKALSPSINDPTTAEHCLDRLLQILATWGRRHPPALQRTEQGSVHFLPRQAEFSDAVTLAFDQIIHFSQDQPKVLQHIRRSLQRLQQLLPPDRHPALEVKLAWIDSL